MSAKKRRLLLPFLSELQINRFVVLRVKLGFSGFDTTISHFLGIRSIFDVVFLALSHYHINGNLHITQLAFKKQQLNI